MTTIIHHSADYDGLFCREIARKHLPEATVIGWDFADAPLAVPSGPVCILDLPVDRVFGFDFRKPESISADLDWQSIIWIDHHKSSIDSHPSAIPGYRIDGVAACRLAWQWFNRLPGVDLPAKDDFVNRLVTEPWSVRMAGEYDIWDRRDSRAEVFQYGLDAQDVIPWDQLLRCQIGAVAPTAAIIKDGAAAQRFDRKRNADVMLRRSHMVEFDGLKFLALNTSKCNSLSFAARDVPETGHDALMGYFWNGQKWYVSIYHARHRTDLDLSVIAAKHGGGGHRGACGWTASSLAFTLLA